MLQTLKYSATRLARKNQLPRALPRRALSATTVRQADLVQDLYLRELKAYKQPAVKLSDSVGHVKKFSPPQPPTSPEEGNIASDLKAYEDQQVEVEGQAAAGETATVEDWFEEEEEEEDDGKVHSSH